MKTVTYEEFLEFKPCWLAEENGAERIKAYFDRFGGRMSALDILNLDDVSKVDKLWSVLREEFIPASILHEFACVCAEYAMSLIENPDPRSMKAIEVKRAWMRGEATDKELAAAWNDARLAARVWAAGDDAWAVSFNVRHAAWTAAGDVASDAARAAACYASEAAWEAARGDSRDAQVAYLIMALEDFLAETQFDSKETLFLRNKLSGETHIALLHKRKDIAGEDTKYTFVTDCCDEKQHTPGYLTVSTSELKEYEILKNDAVIFGDDNGMLKCEDIQFEQDAIDGGEDEDHLSVYIPIWFDLEKKMGSYFSKLCDGETIDIYASLDINTAKIEDCLTVCLKANDEVTFGSMYFNYVLSPGEKEMLQTKVDRLLKN